MDENDHMPQDEEDQQSPDVQHQQKKKQQQQKKVVVNHDDVEDKNAEDGSAEDADVVKADIVTLEVDWVNEIVFYNIRIVMPHEEIVYLMKRYSQFRALNKKLKNTYIRYRLPLLPPKEVIIWTDHTDSKFVEERRALLEHYLRETLNIREIREGPEMNEFIRSNEIEHSVARSIEEQFEGLSQEIMHVDEMEVVSIWIPNVKKMRDHCLYQIHCNKGDATELDDWREWVVLKRYRDFYDMDTKLHTELPLEIAKDLPLLPERQSKLVVDHLDPDFIDQRRILLQNYLQKMLRVPDIQHCPAFLRFVNVSM
jgi:hypothetical protein